MTTTNKIISVFNHKGGVGKTTATIHLAAALKHLGKRVLLVDADSQCNLTSICLLEGIAEDSDDELYDDNLDNILNSNNSLVNGIETSGFHLKAAVSPAFEARPIGLSSITTYEVQSGTTRLIAGNIALGEYEISLGIAQELSGSLTTMRNLPGAFSYVIARTAEKYNIDYTIIDLPPSLSSITQNLVCFSDLVVTPVVPDCFSLLALQSVERTLPKWINWHKEALKSQFFQDADYKIPEKTVKFGGTIIQRYRPRGGVPASGYQVWIDKIVKFTTEHMKKSLRDNYACNSDYLALIPEFNTLGTKSHRHGKAVFDLSTEELQTSGAVLTQEKAKQTLIKNEYLGAANNIIDILSE